MQKNEQTGSNIFIESKEDNSHSIETGVLIALSILSEIHDTTVQNQELRQENHTRKKRISRWNLLEKVKTIIEWSKSNQPEKSRTYNPPLSNKNYQQALKYLSDIRQKIVDESIDNTPPNITTDLFPNLIQRGLELAIRFLKNPELSPIEKQAYDAYLKNSDVDKIKLRFPDVDINIVYFLMHQRQKMDRMMHVSDWFADFILSLNLPTSETLRKDDQAILIFDRTEKKGKKGIPSAFYGSLNQEGQAKISPITLGFDTIINGFLLPEYVNVRPFSERRIFGDMINSISAFNDFFEQLALDENANLQIVHTHVTLAINIPKILAEGRIWSSRQSDDHIADRRTDRRNTVHTFLEEITLKANRFIKNDQSYYLNQMRPRYAKGKEPVFIFNVSEEIKDSWNGYPIKHGGFSISDKQVLAL